MKKKSIFALLAAFVLAFALAACAGQGTLGGEALEEDGVSYYHADADDAGKGSAVGALDSFTVGQGELVVVSPMLSKGKVQVRLTEGTDTEKPVLDEEISGQVLSTYEVAPGTYSISVTVLDDGTTGYVNILPMDKAEYEAQNESLAEELAELGVEDKD